MPLNIPNLRIEPREARFDTHKRYIEFINSEATGLRVTHVPTLIGNKLIESYKSKIKLISLTKRSIFDEIGMLRMDADYGEPASVWLPVKSYYLLYHQISALHYLISGNLEHIRDSHEKTLKWFAGVLQDGSIAFSSSIFNLVADHSIISQSIERRRGEHLSRSCGDETLIKLILKKAGKEKLAEYKRNKSFNLRRADDRARYENHARAQKISFADFFYCTRIRSNYKNVDFIGNVAERFVADYALTWGLAAQKISTSFEPITS